MNLSSLGMTQTHLLKHGTKSINKKNYNNRKKEKRVLSFVNSLVFCRDIKSVMHNT